MSRRVRDERAGLGPTVRGLRWPVALRRAWPGRPLVRNFLDRRVFEKLETVWVEELYHEPEIPSWDSRSLSRSAKSGGFNDVKVRESGKVREG